MSVGFDYSRTSDDLTLTPGLLLVSIQEGLGSATVADVGGLVLGEATEDRDLDAERVAFGGSADQFAGGEFHGLQGLHRVVLRDGDGLFGGGGSLAREEFLGAEEAAFEGVDLH